MSVRVPVCRVCRRVGGLVLGAVEWVILGMLVAADAAWLALTRFSAPLPVHFLVGSCVGLAACWAVAQHSVRALRADLAVLRAQNERLALINDELYRHLEGVTRPEP